MADRIDVVSYAVDWRLWHAPDGTAYVTIDVDDHEEHHRLRSPAIRTRLANQVYISTGRIPRNEARAEALDVLEARARWDGEQHDVHLRVAQYENAIYLDLADAQWRAVKVTAAGWEIVTNPPVFFIRSNTSKPLPVPERYGSLAPLRGILPLRVEDDWLLCVAWLLASLRPRGPYPVLALSGEQGSGKSGFTVALRRMIDPAVAEKRRPPREERELVISAQRSWIVTLENVSSLPAWLSDALCCLSTGGGFAVRALYTDSDELVFEATRPLIINGIEDVVTRGDLADRALAVTLSPLDDTKRMTEADLDARVEAMRPWVLGALLDGVAHALRTESRIKLPSLPRMADAAKWVYAAAPGVGLDPEKVLAAWERRRKAVVASTIEASMIGGAVLALIAELKADWEGTIGDLLVVLSRRVSESLARDSKRWPQTPRGLSGELRRLAPALRAHAVDVVWLGKGRAGQGVRLVAKGVETTVTTVTTVTDPVDADSAGDGRAAAGTPTVTEFALPALRRDGGDGRDSRFPPISTPPRDTLTAYEALSDAERAALEADPLFASTRRAILDAEPAA